MGFNILSTAHGHVRTTKHCHNGHVRTTKQCHSQHSGSWCCTVIPNWVAKDSAVQEILSRQNPEKWFQYIPPLPNFITGHNKMVSVIYIRIVHFDVAGTDDNLYVIIPWLELTDVCKSPNASLPCIDKGSQSYILNVCPLWSFIPSFLTIQSCHPKTDAYNI